jgi:methylglutaconyl-CoA hydratase
MTASESTELVHRSNRGPSAVITLDSPRNRNALSAQLMRELGAQLNVAVEDPAVRCIVLTHTGSVFCSGADLAEATENEGAEGRSTAMATLLESIWASPKPILAQIAGPTRAGGIGLVAACDIAVASMPATFAFSEVRLGLVPAIISAAVLPMMLPRAAHELYLTAEVFDAKRAVAVGLINAACEADQLDETVERYVRLLVLGGPSALTATKRLLRGRPPGDLSSRLVTLQELSTRHFASAEAREGIAAFTGRRPPSWAAKD